MSSSPVRPALEPVRVLILALGGEGGGVLADWLVDTFIEAGFPVQGTSVPGVAQRTGATSYYIEFLDCHRDVLGGGQPVFCLSPSPGQIDLLISSELLETARAIERGFVDPAQTTLISSTARFLTVQEKMQMADGRFDDAHALDAARALSRDRVLFDMTAAAAGAGTVISAVMFGALAGSGRLPLSREQCEATIGRGGRGTQASLRGFAVGFDEARRQSGAGVGIGAGIGAGMGAGIGAGMGAGMGAGASPAGVPPTIDGALIPVRAGDMTASLPAGVASIAGLAVERLTDYQDVGYAQDYLAYVARFVAADKSADHAASRTAARFLALWMSYEDVIRVAELKTRASRFARIRAEVGAAPHEPIVVRDFLKPGVEEIAAVLPPRLATRLRAWAGRRGRTTLSDGLQWRTNTIGGLLALRAMAGLRRWRRRSSRFLQEQAMIARWSDALLRAMAIDPRLSLEIAECPRLLKGYGDTFARGQRSFGEIMTTLIEPATMAGGATPADGKTASNVRATSDIESTAAAIRRAREAALADPEGRELALSLGKPPPEPRTHPIRFVAKKRSPR